MDVRYRREDVDAEVRPVFEQLVAEFGPEYDVRARVDNFSLWVSAGIVNQARRAFVVVEVRRYTRTRTAPLSLSELGRIRDHLAAGRDEPLQIGI
jgi:hypothetical protein